MKKTNRAMTYIPRYGDMTSGTMVPGRAGSTKTVVRSPSNSFRSSAL
ncbi:hypothetical protein ACQEV9_00510 [Streptomyces chartreusis]